MQEGDIEVKCVFLSLATYTIAVWHMYISDTLEND